MRFDELNEDNYIFFAIKHYNNPQCTTREEFEEDLKRFKYVKKLIRKYLKDDILKDHLILNHMIILFNVFNDATVPLLFYKIESNCWPVLKSFLLYLDRFPEGYLNYLDPDLKCLEELSMGRCPC
jgi:hypothetical protein